MRTILICGFLLLACAITALAQENPYDPYSFTSGELQSALRQGHLTTQELNNIQTFDSGDDNRQDLYLAVLSTSRSGWHVSVFHRIRGGFKLEWASGNLPREFDLSSSDGLSVLAMGKESTVMFSGCVPHNGCADSGTLLYSPARKEAFFAFETQQENRPRRFTFSKNALEPKNNRYKMALENAADQ